MKFLLSQCKYFNYCWSTLKLTNHSPATALLLFSTSKPSAMGYVLWRFLYKCCKCLFWIDSLFNKGRRGKVKVSMFMYYDTSGFEEMMSYSGYPDSPDYSGYIDNLDTARSIADSYFIRLQAYFVAPQCGDYVFYVQSDGTGQLYLSTDDNEANKELIVESPYSAFHDWNFS